MLPGVAGLVAVEVKVAPVNDLGVPGRLLEGFDRGDGRERGFGLVLGDALGDGLGEMGFRVLMSRV